MRLLIIGGCGFIGSNFALHRKINFNDKITIFDKLTYAGSTDNLLPLQAGEDYSFFRIDILSEWQVKWMNSYYSGGMIKGPIPDLVINFAAETHVDNSIKDPSIFVQTNFLGAYNVLELCRKYELPIIHISTDEVLRHSPVIKSASPNLEVGRPWRSERLESRGLMFHRVRETKRIHQGTVESHSDPPEFAPTSPYSASKAAAEHLCNAYKETYKLPIDIVRCVNNYGPRQHKEKLLPKAIDRATWQEKIPIYGRGEECRDWIYVQDTCTALDTIIQHRTGKDIWHISAYDEIRNRDIISLLLSTMSQPQDLMEFIPDPRPGHDPVYSLCSDKIRRKGWKPQYTLEKGLDATTDWYIKYGSKIRAGN